MDEDESITMLMAMGFENLDDIRRALRIAKARSSQIKFSKEMAAVMKTVNWKFWIPRQF